MLVVLFICWKCVLRMQNLAFIYSIQIRIADMTCVLEVASVLLSNVIVYWEVLVYKCRM